LVTATSVHVASGPAAARGWLATRWPVFRSKIQMWPARGEGERSSIAHTQRWRRVTSTSIPRVHHFPVAVSVNSVVSSPVAASIL
jgi:hypothetical protein